MRNTALFASIFLVVLALSTFNNPIAFGSTPGLNAKMNLSDGPITVSTRYPVSVQISVEPGGQLGQEAD